MVQQKQARIKGELGVPRHNPFSCQTDAIASKFPFRPLKGPYYFTLVIGTEGMTQSTFKSYLLYYVQNKPLHAFSKQLPPAVVELWQRAGSK